MSDQGSRALSVGLGVSAGLFSLLAGLALVVRTLENVDLKLSLELRRNPKTRRPD